MDLLWPEEDLRTGTSVRHYVSGPRAHPLLARLLVACGWRNIFFFHNDNHITHISTLPLATNAPV